MIRMQMDMVVLLEQHTQRSAPPGLPSGRRFSTAPIVYTSTPGVVCGMQRQPGSGRHVVIAPLSAHAMVSRLRPADPEDLDALFGYDSGGRNVCVGAWMAAMTQTLNVCRDSRTMVISTRLLVPSSVMLVAAPSASAPVRVVLFPVVNPREPTAPPATAPTPPAPPVHTSQKVCCVVM